MKLRLCKIKSLHSKNYFIQNLTFFLSVFQAQPKKVEMQKVAYRYYSPSAMMSASRAVRENHIPVKRAAITYGVPQTTLGQRILGRVDPETTSSGPSPQLSQEEEAIFVEHLRSMAVLGYGKVKW